MKTRFFSRRARVFVGPPSEVVFRPHNGTPGSIAWAKKSHEELARAKGEKEAMRLRSSFTCITGGKTETITL